MRVIYIHKIDLIVAPTLQHTNYAYVMYLFAKHLFQSWSKCVSSTLYTLDIAVTSLYIVYI
jgi:hypothetical protein